METIYFACPVGLAYGKEKILTFQALHFLQQETVKTQKIKYKK
jgi:hypothetical protein